MQVKAIIADLSTEAGVNQVYESLKIFGPLDVAVLNAGAGVGGEFTATSFEEEKKIINLNFTYLVALTKKILKDFTARDAGKILFTSSIAGEMPGPYYAVYAATKAAVQSFVEAIRYEVKEAKKHITITALQPGATDTNFFARAHMLNTPAGKGKKDDPAEVAQDGYDALMAGKDSVVAGSFKNSVQAGMAKVVPQTTAAGMHAKSTKPEDLES